MFEIEQLKPLVFGILGGSAGFLLHKNLKISKGLGIGLGSVLGVVIAYNHLKQKQKKREEGNKERSECMKKYNIGQMVDFSKMSKEQVISKTLENSINAQKYGALCNSYMVL